MYREIIEDFSAIPRFLQQQYAESLIAGKDHGRIWRLSWQKDQATASRGSEPLLPAKLSSATIDDLVKALDNPNPWWRETAQHLLLERRDKSAVPALASLVRQGKTAPGRTHALYALDGLARLEQADVVAALGDGRRGSRARSATG